MAKTPMGGGLDYAVIGNCRIAALCDVKARILWWCFPRFDGDPVFSRMLAGDEEKGFCDVVLENQAKSVSTYDRNTPIVETVLSPSMILPELFRLSIVQRDCATRSCQRAYSPFSKRSGQ